MKTRESKLIGKEVKIKESSSSWLAGGHGIVTMVDGDTYYIAPWGDNTLDLCFSREEFIVKRGLNNDSQRTTRNHSR